MKYRIHIGIGIENAKKHSAICEFNHEFLAELVEVIENQPKLDIVLSNFDAKKRYLELNGDFGDLEKLKNEFSNSKIKKSIEEDFECLILACDKALKHNMHLYLIME